MGAGITNYGISGNSLMWAGSANPPRYLEIGSGSGTFLPTLGSLYDAIGSRIDFTTRDIGTAAQVDFQWDKNSVDMSGVNLREILIGGSAATDSNDGWFIANFPSTAFDGTNELQVQVVLKSFR